MSEQVYWHLELRVKDGQLEAFRTLMDEMVTATWGNEPGALNYEWTISEDEKSVHIYERYADSAATMTHLASFGRNFADRFLGCVDPTYFVVYGKPDDEVRGALAPFGAVHMNDFGGFAR